MKKFIVFIVGVIVLIAAVRAVMQHSDENPEAFSKIQEWAEPWKEKAESVADGLSQQFSEQFSENIAGQDWESQGVYDIDTAGWFEDDENVLGGSLEYTQLSSGQVNNLVLRAAGCKVELIQSEETDFYYAFENMKKVQAYQEADSVVLTVMRDTELSSGLENSVLKLYVPAECYLTNAELEIGAGSMSIDVLNVQELELTAEAGKLTLDSLQAKTLTATLGAGAVSLKDVKLQDANLTVGAGSMSVEGQIFGNIKAECAMGSLQMKLLGAIQDFNYEVQCVAGNIQIGEEKYSGVNEEKLIDNAAEKTMEFNCAMGSMIIGFEEMQ